MSENMRGLFFVVKGQYKKGVAPSFVNKVTEDTMYLGGFDPYSEDTLEWYMVYDNKKYHCVSCGSDLSKVVKGVYHIIKKYKGDVNKYFKFVEENRQLYKASPIMIHLHEKVYEEYGDFFSDDVREMDLAYEELKEERPIKKTRKLMKKTKNNSGVEIKTPVKTQVMETPTPKKVKPKVKMGLKKLSMD